MRRTLTALATENAGWRPRAFEATFGMAGKPELTVAHDARAGDALRLRGVIDRVDSDGRGGLRIIDYKRGGLWGYDDRSLAEGRHLQLPLYALAASRALEHGRAVDGFYWSVTRAEASRLCLGKFGVEEAAVMALAHAWEAVEGARAGRFQPQTPRDGCPPYCPAAAFCWHYREKR
jgi:RecB family exonuclease